MNLKLELTEDCQWCHGIGWKYKDLFGDLGTKDFSRIDCGRCRATGQVPTWQGIELLTFIDTYKDWMEDD